MTIFSKAFWKYAGERAVKTFAQALIGSVGAGAAASAIGADWKFVLLSAVIAAGVSVLTSITAYTGPSAPAQPDPATAPADPSVPSVQ